MSQKSEFAVPTRTCSKDMLQVMSTSLGWQPNAFLKQLLK